MKNETRINFDHFDKVYLILLSCGIQLLHHGISAWSKKKSRGR